MKPKSRKPWNLAYDINPKAGKVEQYTPDFPAGFIVTIDSREQLPLFLKKPLKDLIIKRTTLPVGDYSVDGFAESCAVERKSLPDLYHSLGQDRARFKRELEKLATYEFKALVIEGSELDLFRWQDFSRMHPRAIFESVVSINVRLNINIYFGSRDNIEQYILSRFIKFYKIKRGL
jgi:ERCC4-type nuclease